MRDLTTATTREFELRNTGLANITAIFLQRIGVLANAFLTELRLRTITIGLTLPHTSTIFALFTTRTTATELTHPSSASKSAWTIHIHSAWR